MRMYESDFRIYRRRLPHWRMADELQHVVWRLASGSRPLSAGERSVVVSALRHFDGKRYTLVAYAVMDDHVHVVVNPHDTPVERMVHSWKSFTANVLQRQHGRTGAVWQDEYYDRIVRDDGELEQTLLYVVYNPMERWPDLRDYAWVWQHEDPGI